MLRKSGALVSDFDGTITERDFYLLVAERYMGPDAMNIWDSYRAGRLTHFQAMQAFFSHAPSEEPELNRLLHDTRPDPKFADAVRDLRTHGWDLIIVSAGSSWYIERILKFFGVQATIHSNPGRIIPGHGLVMELAADAPFFCPDVGVDKTAVVTEALRRYARVAFAGDGPPDVSPALSVPSDLRFARGFLAEELQRRRADFQRFEKWSEIVSRLVATDQETP